MVLIKNKTCIAVCRVGRFIRFVFLYGIQLCPCIRDVKRDNKNEKYVQHAGANRCSLCICPTAHHMALFLFPPWLMVQPRIQNPRRRNSSHRMQPRRKSLCLIGYSTPLFIQFPHFHPLSAFSSPFLISTNFSIFISCWLCHPAISFHISSAVSQRGFSSLLSHVIYAVLAFWFHF